MNSFIPMRADPHWNIAKPLHDQRSLPTVQPISTNYSALSLTSCTNYATPQFVGNIDPLFVDSQKMVEVDADSLDSVEAVNCSGCRQVH